MPMCLPQNFVERGLGGLTERFEEFFFPEEPVPAEFVRRQQSSGHVLTQRGKRHAKPLGGVPNLDELSVLRNCSFCFLLHDFKDMGRLRGRIINRAPGVEPGARHWFQPSLMPLLRRWFLAPTTSACS